MFTCPLSPPILPVDPTRPAGLAIERACVLLRDGALIVIPTETVYGLAADAAAEGAERRVYEAKGRDEKKPLPLMVAGVAQAEAAGVRFDPAARVLAARFWPGPLTMVLPGAGREEGVRVPDHPVALAVLEAMGRGLRVTSANRSGEAAAVTAAEAAAALEGRVALVLDAGPCRLGEASTVVRLSGGRVEVLRSGALSLSAIEECLDRSGRVDVK